MWAKCRLKKLHKSLTKQQTNNWSGQRRDGRHQIWILSSSPKSSWLIWTKFSQSGSHELVSGDSHQLDPQVLYHLLCGRCWPFHEKIFILLFWKRQNNWIFITLIWAKILCKNYENLNLRFSWLPNHFISIWYHFKFKIWTFQALTFK